MYVGFIQSQIYTHWVGALRHCVVAKSSGVALIRCGFALKLGYNFQRLFNL
jgi:hypothetical protein